MFEPVYQIVAIDRKGKRQIVQPCLRSIEAIGYMSSFNRMSLHEKNRSVAVAELVKVSPMGKGE